MTYVYQGCQKSLKVIPMDNYKNPKTVPGFSIYNALIQFAWFICNWSDQALQETSFTTGACPLTCIYTHQHDLLRSSSDEANDRDVTFRIWSYPVTGAQRPHFWSKFVRQRVNWCPPDDALVQTCRIGEWWQGLVTILGSMKFRTWCHSTSSALFNRAHTKYGRNNTILHWMDKKFICITLPRTIVKSGKWIHSMVLTRG